MVAHSATLALNEQMEALQASGRKGLHLGFGEAGIPVHPAIAEVLADAVTRTSYAPVAGSPQAREAAAGYFERRGLPTTPEQIVFGPGSKSLLYALIASLPGDVVLPRPSWVSYEPQAELAGKQVIGTPIPAQAGGVPDPDRLGACLESARAEGKQPGILVLTTPDNPTGTVAGPDVVKQVCAAAEEEDLVIVADEIYRDLCYEPEALQDPALLAPARCFVTGGLSKATALGGWRVGFARFPDNDLGRATHEDVIGVASEVWSCMADPMQPVAAYVLSEPAEVTDHVAASRRLHQQVSTAVHAVFTEAGAECRAPQGGFYVYPDFGPCRDGLGRAGITTGVELCRWLLEEQAVGVLNGAAFGDEPEGLRFRAATSLLYGVTPEERWEALRADEPTALPWIAASLDHLRTALAALPT